MSELSADAVVLSTRPPDSRSFTRCRGWVRGETTHDAASLMSAADQQIPDDTRVMLEN
jgi:hypothetical protein